MSSTLTEPVQFLSRSEIENKAGEVLRRHDLTALPVDPLVLANREGIQVNNAKFLDKTVVGMIVKRGGDVAMLVDQNDPPYQKRFTIAHQLGHHFLHLVQDGEFVDKEADLFRREMAGEHGEHGSPREKEIQANAFAASLLMPADEIRKFWKGSRSIEELARIFNVSIEAMGYRVASLDLG